MINIFYKKELIVVSRLNHHLITILSVFFKI